MPKGTPNTDLVESVIRDKCGTNAGFTWNALAEKIVVYTDLGISRGMQAGIDLANRLAIEIEYRSLGLES